MFLAGSMVPALLIAAAAIFVAILTMYLRARAIDDAYAFVPEWPQQFVYGDDGSCEWTSRVELIERLTFIAEPWCVDTLREATKEERDPRVRKALDAAWKTLR